LFSFVPGARVTKDPVSDRLESFIRYGAAFEEGCAAIEPTFEAQDIVIVAFSTDREVYGVARWLGTVPEDRRPRVVFIFMTPDFRWKVSGDRESLSGDVSFHRYAANQLAEVSDRFYLFAGSDKLRGALTGAFGHPCAAAPMPQVYFAPDDVPGSPDDPQWTPAHVGFVGEYRSEKGGGLVPEAVELFCRARPGRKVFLQVQNAEQAGVLSARLKNTAEVQIHLGQLSQRSYIERLQSLDILLLPYMPERYAIRTSGIFAEAVAYGLVPVVPENTWMSDQLAAGWGSGVTFADASAEAITSALIGASDSLPALKKKAMARREAWRAGQSTPALLDAILDRLAAGC
jgi:hypothetical protein